MSASSSVCFKGSVHPNYKKTLSLLPSVVCSHADSFVLFLCTLWGLAVVFQKLGDTFLILSRSTCWTQFINLNHLNEPKSLKTTVSSSDPTSLLELCVSHVHVLLTLTDVGVSLGSVFCFSLHTAATWLQSEQRRNKPGNSNNMSFSILSYNEPSALHPLQSNCLVVHRYNAFLFLHYTCRLCDILPQSTERWTVEGSCKYLQSKSKMWLNASHTAFSIDCILCKTRQLQYNVGVGSHLARHVC